MIEDAMWSGISGMYTDLVHIAVAANGESSVGNDLLYIKQPVFENLKTHLMFHNPLRDQAFFKIESSTLPLRQAEGATKIPTSLYSRNVQLKLLKQIKICTRISLDGLQNFCHHRNTQN
jgi:hypothetical protein